MIDSLAAALTAHRHLVILRLLTEINGTDLLRALILRLLHLAPAHSLSLSVLADVLRQNGIKPGGDKIAAAAAWLAEQELAMELPGLTGLLTLTGRGLDVSDGAASHPGVAALPTPAWLAAALPAAGINVGAADIQKSLEFLRDAGLVRLDLDLVLPMAAAADVVAGRLPIDGIHTPSPASMMTAAAKAAKALLVR